MSHLKRAIKIFNESSDPDKHLRFAITMSCSNDELIDLGDSMLVVSNCSVCKGPRGYIKDNGRIYFEHGCLCTGSNKEEREYVALECYLEDHPKAINNLIKRTEERC